MKYKTFDLAIMDGNGITRDVIPMSMDKEQTVDIVMKEHIYKFTQLRLFEQGYETYGCKAWIENQDESDEIGEYHYDGGFEEQ